MKIIEKYIMSKWGDLARCEDGIFINDNYIAVVDGATSKGKLNWDGKTSGFIAKETIIKALESLKSDCSAYEAFNIINDALRDKYKEKLRIAENDISERLQASLVIYSIEKKQIWNLGDCKFIINNRLYNNEKKIDNILAEVRSIVVQMELLKGKSAETMLENDIGREFILPVLKEQGIFINNDSEYGYNIIDGITVCDNRIDIIPVPDESMIILATDGYPILKNTLIESEESLKELLINDPLCIY